MFNFNQIKNSYSYQFYKLNNLKKIKEPMLELGRFCIDPNYKDPKIIMTAWFAIRNLIEKNHIKFLFEAQVFLEPVLKDIWIVSSFWNVNTLPQKNLSFMLKAPKVFKFDKLINLNNFCF